MPAVSTPSRKKSWQTGRQRVSVLAALAIKRDAISRRLLQIREDNRDPTTGEKLTQEDAALRVGVRARTWQRWEAGETVPYPKNLSSISDAFRFDVAEFFDSEPGSVSDTPDPFATPLAVGQLDRIEAMLRALLRHAGYGIEFIDALGDPAAPTVEDESIQPPDDDEEQSLGEESG